jgi:hypothetical protein
MDVTAGRGVVVVRVPADGGGEAFAEAGRLLSAGRSVVVVLDPTRPVDVGTVGALARLVLRARRGDAGLVVHAPDAALRELAELMGLCDLLGLGGEPTGADPASGQPQR